MTREPTVNISIWRPADTAPRDGTEFQGWFETQNGSGFWEPSCRYNKNGGLGVWGRVDYDTDGWDYGLSHLTLTHWMPQVEESTEQEQHYDQRTDRIGLPCSD